MGTDRGVDEVAVPDPGDIPRVRAMNGPRVLIQGAGDVGSAVAHRLFRAGYAVAIHESAQPASTRRGMAFTDAVFDGRAVLDDLAAERLDDIAALPATLAGRSVVPVVITGVPVIRGTKVIEVDPRGDAALVRGIGERPARIADSVLAVVDRCTGR